MPLTSRAEKSLILFECSYWFRSWNLGFFMGWNVHGDCTQDKRKLVVHPRRNDLLSSCISIHHPFGGLSSLAQPHSGVDSLRFKYWMSIEIPREERFWCPCLAISLIPHETIALLITMINSYDLVLQLARGFQDFGGDRQDLMLQVLSISAISFLWSSRT